MLLESSALPSFGARLNFRQGANGERFTSLGPMLEVCCKLYFIQVPVFTKALDWWFAELCNSAGV